MFIKGVGECVCVCVMCGVIVYVNKCRSGSCFYGEIVRFWVLEEVYVSIKNV